MSFAVRPLLTLVLLAPLVVAAPVPKVVKPKDDKSLIVGSWKTSAENGELGDKVHTHTFEYHDDGSLKMTYGKNNAVSEWTWTIDAEASPKRMGWVQTTTGGSKFDCVYEVEGDTLKVALINSGQPRPEKLERGKGYYLYELTRDGK